MAKERSLSIAAIFLGQGGCYIWWAELDRSQLHSFGNILREPQEWFAERLRGFDHKGDRGSERKIGFIGPLGAIALLTLAWDHI
jgi:hypothetical protein